MYISLTDLVVISEVWDRGYYGSGHGWSGNTIVFWNCESRASFNGSQAFRVDSPATGANYCVGYLSGSRIVRPRLRASVVRLMPCHAVLLPVCHARDLLVDWRAAVCPSLRRTMSGVHGAAARAAAISR